MEIIATILRSQSSRRTLKVGGHVEDKPHNHEEDLAPVEADVADVEENLSPQFLNGASYAYGFQHLFDSMNIDMHSAMPHWRGFHHLLKNLESMLRVGERRARLRWTMRNARRTPAGQLRELESQSLRGPLARSLCVHEML